MISPIRPFRTVYVFVFGLLNLMAGCRPASKPAERPNILLIIADDWSYPHLGALGEPELRTPNIDRLAREGLLFHHAYCAAPSCTPSRAALLTGQFPHQLGHGANLWSLLDTVHPNYVNLLEAAGYATGMTQKGWGPGDEQAGGYHRNPAGPRFMDFKEFLDRKPPEKPFCFWLGTFDPHRDYVPDQGIQRGMRPDSVRVPGFLPDHPEVRKDLTDYFFEIERLDQTVGEAIALLEARGELDKTLIVVTSDNGMPFPRAKANLYDGGTRVPLVVRWPAPVRPNRTTDEMVSLIDLAPTFLEAAGLPVPETMAGSSLMDVLRDEENRPKREWVFFERERHAHVREGNLGYPARGVRTHDFLFIRNFEPDRWPAGDPVLVHSVGAFGDTDQSVTKDLIMAMKETRSPVDYYQHAFGKRPMEELYDLKNDPDQLVNKAESATLAMMKVRMQKALLGWMQATGDPRFGGKADFDAGPYFGPPTSPQAANQHGRSK